MVLTIGHRLCEQSSNGRRRPTSATPTDMCSGRARDSPSLGTPPTWMRVHSDLFHDEDFAYAERLTELVSHVMSRWCPAPSTASTLIFPKPEI